MSAAASLPDRVVIIGAGAAGLATAIFTKRLAPALPVVLLEGAARPGAKILVSGGSRCNVTNAAVSERDFWGGRPSAIRRVLRAMPATDTVEFFREIGVPLHEEEDGKLFPDSNRSRDVLDALLHECSRVGAELRAGHRVTDILRDADRFVVETIRGPIDAGAVVLATGGRSLPKSGSDGAGYGFAERLGHTIVPTTPALAPLVLADDERAIHGLLSGVAVKTELAIWVDGALERRLAGAILWTHFGISGPVALNASRHWLRARLEGRQVRVTANFCGGASFDAFERRWIALATERPRLALQTALSSVVPSSLAAALLRELALDGGIVLAQLPRDPRRRVIHALVEYPMPIVDSRGYTFAEATAGGVALDEVDPATLESRRQPGLFLVGEVLDVDGRLGGFNFQWAWASARAAAGGLAARSRPIAS